MKVALVGDYDKTVTAHQAIPRAIDLAARALAITVEPVWIRSREVVPEALAEFDALWCVPFSPYQNPAAVIAAIRFARERDMPFLGTCAGYQHAVLEFARNPLGFEQADSVEDNPDTQMPLLTALACRLYDKADAINIEPGSRVAEIYQTDRVFEEYHCGFGVNPEYLKIFTGSELHFSGYDDNNEPRICEIPGNRFFVGTAYQPERSALRHKVHPILTTFLAAGL